MRRLAMKALTLALVVLLGGCATYTAALYDTGPASCDWIQCQKDTSGYGTIPDFGITLRTHFAKCMREAGWEQFPDKPDGSGWGPTAYRRPSAD